MKNIAFGVIAGTVLTGAFQVYYLFAYGELLYTYDLYSREWLWKVDAVLFGIVCTLMWLATFIDKDR